MVQAQSPFVDLDLQSVSAFDRDASPPAKTDPFISNNFDPEPRLIWAVLPYVASKTTESKTCKLKKTL